MTLHNQGKALVSKSDKNKGIPILSFSKDKGDFEVKTCRGSGPGGQNRNKRDTAVIITHKASGLRARCEQYRTQEENKAAAFRKLVTSEEFLLWVKLKLIENGINTETERPSGPTGSRGNKIRTYNIPRDEVIDHRTGKKIKGVQRVLDGELDLLMDLPNE